MQQQLERLPLPLQSAAPVTPRTTKMTGLHWAFPLFTAVLRNLSTIGRAGKRADGTPQEYIIIISLHYGGWKDHPNGENMQLEGVKNDVKALLDHLGYRHDNADGRHWDFLLDYDLDYKDPSGTTKRLPRTGPPTRDNTLETLQEATRKGTSVLVHYGGHCHYAAPGASELEHRHDGIIYKEIEDSRGGLKAAFLVSSDGKRIYWKDFCSSLHGASEKACASAIMVVLDTCKAEAFIKDFGNLAIIYDDGSREIAPDAPIVSTPPLDHLVVVTAARADELAWTFDNCGVLTYFLIKCLKDHPEASAAQVVQYLNIDCRKQPDKKHLQRPRIWSRNPLQGPFRLLPRNASPAADSSPPFSWRSWLEACLDSTSPYVLGLQALQPAALSMMLL